jgi:uncharacterized LabA/DUF88 family protein
MRTYVYIDASNLFYGGKKSLGWSVDYEKLYQYLENRYQASQVFYFGGVETHRFPFDYLANDTVPLQELERYLADYAEQNKRKLSNVRLALLDRHLNQVRFYRKLEKFGYKLVLKPVKTFYDAENLPLRKANCDVDMAFYLMRDADAFERVIILSGDGDFLPVLKYLRDVKKKEVLILARGLRTAKEVKQFAGDKFLDFTNNLRVQLERHEA